MDGRQIVQELKSRHIASTAPTSRALVATIDALTETLEAAGNVNDLLSYVGACVSSLDSVSSADDAPVISAVCTLLATLLPAVSQQQTRSIFLKTSPVVCKITSLLYEAADVAGVKWAAQVLAQLLCCPDTDATWAPVKAPLLMLVRIAMHSNAKARKVAQEGLSNVLCAYSSGPSHRPASEEIEQVAKVVLAAPQLAAKQAASATKSQREDAEEAIVQSVQDCLYFLGALKLLMPHLTGTSSLRVCEFVLDTFVLAQPILTMNGVDCLIRALQGFSQQGVPAAKTQQLLAAVLPMLDTQKQASVLLSLVRFVEDGLRELHQASPSACEQSLPSAVVKLVEMLGAETEEVRFAAASAVTTVFQCCVSPELVLKCSADSAASNRRENPLQRCMVAMVSMLGVGYRDSWPHVLRCLADIFMVLGPPGAPLAVPVLEVLSNMARGYEEGGDHVALANSAIGACISSIGPQVVLQVAPIDVQDLANCNTWVLPLLRKHTRCTQMSLWGEYLLPRARAVGSVAIKARDSGKSSEFLKLSALELQMWNVLESFSRWARDVPEALESFGETLGAAFHSRMDLQIPICSALKQLCIQTSAALHNAGEADGAGFGLASGADLVGDDTASVAVPRHMFEDTVVSHFDIDVAKSNRDSLRGIAQKWLQELLNRFVQLKPDKRGPVGETISAMAMVAGEAITATFYKEALSKVIAALQVIKAGNVIGDPEAEVCTFLEVGLLLAGGISDAATLPLFKAAQLTLAIKKPAPQKKAYKVLSYLFVKRPKMLEQCKTEAVAILLETSSADVAAKRFRLRCMQPVIMLLSREGEAAWCSPSDQPAQAASLIAELVLGIKEVNAKTRTEAYRVLAATAHALHAADPPEHSNNAHANGDAAVAMKLDDGGLQRMFACTLAGVASQSPRMISASVMALARLLFEFPAELQLPGAVLLPSLCTLLHSKAREVIKSVLGFLKVAAVRLPVEILQQHMATMIEGLLIWAQDSKNKFKMKVRRLLERLCKRCGYEAVAAAWPDADPKLLSSIRKGLARTTREKTARKNAAGDGTEGGSEVSEGRKTVSGSEWRHTQIFSDDGEEGGGGEDGDARSRAGQSVARSSAARSKAASGAPTRKGGSKAQLVNEGSNPVNLLDSAASSALMRSAAGKRHAAEETQGASEFQRNAAGKLMFKEEKEGKEEEDDPLNTKWRKRPRPDGAAADSDDSDFEDMRGVAGLPAAMKGTQGARSLKGASKYAHSHASQAATMKSKASRATDPGQHSAAKYKAKKASGDNQGDSNVQPYAYWRFDKNMLNTRTGKNQKAKSQLGSMVKTGVVRGNKAKKARKSA